MCLEIPFSWIKLVISHTYPSGTGEDCRAVKVKAQKELGSSAGTEGWDLVFVNYLLSLLSMSCHPQAYGYLLHWPCGGCSRDHIVC